ncbi:hypothetical protein VP01_576g1 [Puccinia sorghi]|uniref:Uncharacterized protein n=1 Tax=Puccinia sorghi TaxID=27349 RepID=A0A0L6UJ34_9BASI|nr:hypothetical protein VP01_576g1 [Puccinia sorghi]
MENEKSGSAKEAKESTENNQDGKQDNQQHAQDNNPLELFPIDTQQQVTFDSLNILSELATSVGHTAQSPTNQQQSTISDNAFQALLLASLSDQFPTNPLSSSSSSSSSSTSSSSCLKKQPSNQQQKHSKNHSPSSTSTHDLLHKIDLSSFQTSSTTALAQLQSSPAFDSLNLHHSPTTPNPNPTGRNQEQQHNNNPNHQYHLIRTRL